MWFFFYLRVTISICVLQWVFTHVPRLLNVKMVQYLLNNRIAPLVKHDKATVKKCEWNNVYILAYKSQKECECTNQLEQVFPEVLCHEAEEGEEGPAEGVVVGVSVIRIPPRFYTHVSLRTQPINITFNSSVIQKGHHSWRFKNE